LARWIAGVERRLRKWAVEASRRACGRFTAKNAIGTSSTPREARQVIRPGRRRAGLVLADGGRGQPHVGGHGRLRQPGQPPRLGEARRVERLDDPGGLVGWAIRA
jgi:hypothetical protein